MRRRWLLPLAFLAAPGLAPAADVALETGKDTIEFKVGTEVVAKYQYAGTVRVEKGEGAKPLAKPFLWPVLAPNGVPVTRAWPMDRTGPDKTDHFHQKSAWFCHGDVIPEGIDLKGKHAVDFWSEFPGHGRIVCVKVGDPKPAMDRVSVTTWNEWQTADGVKILGEERTIMFRDLPAGRLFAFEITLRATVCPITFGDTKEGSFGVRVNDAMRTELTTGGTVTAADGSTIKAPMKDNLAVWGKPADWHDYSGMVGGKEAGIAVFDHPDNPSRANWHTRAYGLMAANPFGRDKSGFPAEKGKTDLVRIEKGKELKFRYAIYAHSGDAKAGRVAEAYELFKK
jgi:hypothetical protein